MRFFIKPSLLLAAGLLFASGFSAHAHHGGDHPAWEVDEFADEAFKVAPGVWIGAAAGILLCAGGMVATKRQPERQAKTARRRQG